MYADTFDQSKNEKHVETCPESSFSGSGRSKHSHSKSGLIDGSRSSRDSDGQIELIARDERVLEGGESNFSETHTNGTGSIWESARSSNSSSSSESSSDVAFEVETIDFESESFRPASKNQQNDVSGHSSSFSSEVDSNSSSVSTSTCVPPTVSPPVKVMDPSGGYDPNRIPSSIFGRSNTSPVEWSTASNESLFSIHLGNYSFSRDHFMFDDLYKSGELTKSGELRTQPSFVIPEDIETEKENVDNMEDLQTNKMLDKAFESEKRSNEEQNKAQSLHPDLIWKSHNVSGRSHGSGTSSCSFAFPILIEADRLGAHKADISPRKSVEESCGPLKEDASKLAPHSTANICNWFCCFSWSFCWSRGKCCYCRCC